MILVFEFLYISTNEVLANFLEDIAKTSKLEYFISKNGDTLSLHVRASEDEVLFFSEHLSRSLPFSIFLKSTNVKATDNFDKDKAISIKNCEIFTSFTPKAQLIADHNFNPFVKNEVGLNPKISAPLIFTKEDENIEISYENSYKEAFEKISELIFDGEKVLLKTPSKSYQICSISTKISFDKNFIIMPTDCSFIDSLAVASQNEISTLVSLEKPIINLKTNLIFKSKYTNFPDFANVAMPDNLFTHLLCKTLHENGVKFLILSDEKTCTNSLTYDGFDIDLKQLEVVVLENGEVLILKGNRYLSSVLKNSIKYLNSASHTQYVSLLCEHNFLTKNSCCFYLSFKNADKLMYYSEESGVLDLVDISFENSGKEIFDVIAKDETANRLLKNYKKEFGQIFQTANSVNLDNRPKNILNIIGFLGIILGLADNIEDGQKAIIENFRSFGGLKGPSIDFVLNDEKNMKTTFNHYKLIRSVISFKLADVNNETISFGIMESLVYFLSSMADSFKENLKTESVMLGGSLFGISSFSSLCVKHITPNHKVLFNKELPIELVIDETVHQI